jgi:hypothetical protein
MDNNVSTYLGLKIGSKTIEKRITTSEPFPNERDYRAGYIIRYFVRKRNDANGTIYEVDKNNYESYRYMDNYLTCTLRWKIVGGNKFEVEQLNQRSINYAQETMGNIDTYVGNLTKFYRG